MPLVIFGLLVSVPIIVWGSQLVIKLMDRFPIVITLGGMLLGWIAGGLIVGDTLLEGRVPHDTATRYLVSGITAFAVVVVAKVMQARHKGRSRR